MNDMLAWWLLQCLTLVVQIVSASNIGIFKSDQSHQPLHILGHCSCQKNTEILNYQSHQIVSASVYSFGLFTEAKEFSLCIKMAISCLHKTKFTLLALADWKISVNCVESTILFGQDSFDIQENATHVLQMDVIDSSMATLKVDSSHSSKPVESSKITEEMRLLVAPTGEIAKDITLYEIILTTQDRDQEMTKEYGKSIHAEMHVNPVVTVHEKVTIDIIFRDRTKEMSSIPLYKVSIPGIPDDRIGCAEKRCTVSFPVAGVFSCTLIYVLDGETRHTTRDIIVRKIDDPSTSVEFQFSSMYNSNGLRPLDRSTYRSQIGLTIAKSLNWSEEYYFGNDSVSERLFDYRILDNNHIKSILRVVKCEDMFLAGGLRIKTADDPTSGLGKRVLFVPMKYASTTDGGSFIMKRRNIENILNPHGSPYGCSNLDVESLIQYSGMFDMVNHQLIRDSYGQLSLDMNPAVSQDIILNTSGNPSPSPYDIISEGLVRASRSDTLQYWALVALAPFPLRPHMPDFKVWYRSPKEIVMTSACSISTYHMLHEFYHMLGSRHPYQYRVSRPPGGNIISPLDDSGQWVRDNQYQESFDVLGCCSGDASLSTRILNGWVTWPGSRVEVFIGPTITKKDLILYPFDSPEISKGKSPLGAVVRLNITHTLVCGYRDLSRWPISFNTGDVVLATRNNLRGIECEILQSMQDTLMRTTLDFSLLKDEVFHQYRGGDFHQRKIFSLLGDQMAFHAPQHSLRLVHKGLVPCNSSIPSVGQGLVKHYMGLTDEYPFQETYGTRATYSLESRCAAIHLLHGDTSGIHIAQAMPIQFLVSRDTAGETYLVLDWNPQNLNMAGISFKTETNETIESLVSPDMLNPLYPPIQALWVSDPCLHQHGSFHRIDMIDYTGRSLSSQIRYEDKRRIDIITRFSNNLNRVERTEQSVPLPLIQKQCTSHSYIHINMLHVLISSLFLLV